MNGCLYTYVCVCVDIRVLFCVSEICPLHLCEFPCVPQSQNLSDRVAQKLHVRTQVTSRLHTLRQLVALQHTVSQLRALLGTSHTPSPAGVPVGVSPVDAYEAALNAPLSPDDHALLTLAAADQPLLDCYARYCQQPAALLHSMWQPAAATASSAAIPCQVPAQWSPVPPSCWALWRETVLPALDRVCRRLPRARGQAQVSPVVEFAVAQQALVELQYVLRLRPFIFSFFLF